jgi:hypothetical protein
MRRKKATGASTGGADIIEDTIKAGGEGDEGEEDEEEYVSRGYGGWVGLS